MGLRSHWDAGRLPDAIGVLARLILGVVLIWAGAAKVTSPALSARAVRAYQILPYDLAGYVGYALPVVEVLVGLLLVIGLFTRASAVVGGLLMLWLSSSASALRGRVGFPLTAAVSAVGERSRPLRRSTHWRYCAT